MAYNIPELFGATEECPAFFHAYEALGSSLRTSVNLQMHLLCVLHSGQKIILHKQGRVVLNPGQAALLPAGSVLMTENKKQDEPFLSSLLFFSDSFWRDFSARYSLRATSISASNAEINDIAFPAQSSNWIRWLDSMAESVKSPHKQAVWELKAAEALLLIDEQSPEILAQFQRAQRPSGAPDIRQVLEAHWDEALTLEQMAFLSHRSLATFKRHFQEAYGCSPGQYRIERKMKKAQQLLTGRYNLGEISDILGYESTASFSHEFKKHFGVSPSQYRQQRVEMS